MSRSLTFACIAEAGTGAALALAPSLVTRWLLGGEVDGVGAAAARVAGIAIVALAVACWPRPAGRFAVLGMLGYSAMVCAYLAYLGAHGDWVGPALWPAVGLHAVLSVALVLTAVAPSTQAQGS